MRDILFRGKLQVGRGFVIGDLCHIGSDYFIATVDDEHKYSFNLVNPETIGEYTGMKDCFGIEIFEGDIVNLYYRGFIEGTAYIKQCTVVYDDLGFHFKLENGDYIDDWRKGFMYMQVVSNIHRYNRGE